MMEIRFCPDCGRERPQGALFCGGCGRALAADKAPQTDGYAVASLVAGLIGLGVGSVLAVVFGHKGLGRIRRAERGGQARGGRGLAVAGLVLGYAGVALTLVVAVSVPVLLGQVEAAEDSAARQDLAFASEIAESVALEAGSYRLVDAASLEAYGSALDYRDSAQDPDEPGVVHVSHLGEAVVLKIRSESGKVFTRTLSDNETVSRTAQPPAGPRARA